MVQKLRNIFTYGKNTSELGSAREWKLKRKFIDREVLKLNAQQK